MLILRDIRFRLTVALFALSLLAVACSVGAKNEPYFGKIQPPEGQVLRYVSGTEPQSLDPQYMTGQPESRIAVALFDGLVEYEERTMGQRPSLATSWEPNSDGTVWTFHLRNNARWTDGMPITAHDFVYSWRRALSAELAAPYASFMYILKNGQPYNEQSAFVRDPQTGKYATEEDFKRSGTDGAITFTGDAPERFDEMPAAQAPSAQTSSQQPATVEGAETKKTSVKYLFVPADADDREKLLKKEPVKSEPGHPELAPFVKGKEFVPVTKEYVGVRALDDYTFQVTLEGPTAYFIKMLNNQFFRPVPRQAIENSDNARWTKPQNIVTSGAFKMAEWKPYEYIMVVRNTDFWDNANTKLDKIIFPSIESLTTTMNLYKAGEVDSMSSNRIPPPWRNELKTTKKDYVDGPYLQITALAIKTIMPPLNDVRVRKALSMAIDRRIIADQAVGRIPTTSFTPKMEGYENAEGEGYNPERARQLLAEAGFPGGRGLPQLEILYNTAESNKQTQEIIQQMWKKELGIKVNLINQEWRVFLENSKPSKLNFNGFSQWLWIGDYVDPNSFLELLVSGSENNHSAWKDKKYDAMLKEANAEVDNARRMKMLHDAEAYMLSQQPMIPLFVGPSSFLSKPYVKNLVANLLDQHDWRNVYIDHSVTAESLGLSFFFPPPRPELFLQR
ncbi:MAG TPA: peptide ABC transporter substrate-binding protein [Pyrinomonadaceae bacterium]|jgi:oligopeptide transport system substrate-binding protein